MLGNYDITYEGKQAGKLKIYNEGLKTVFSAETIPFQGVTRLAVVSNGKTIPIGVLLPSGKGLSILKGFSKNSLNELGISEIDKVVILAQETEKKTATKWREVSDTAAYFSDPDLKAAGKGAKGVLMSSKDDEIELAFPVRKGMPFSLMPAFCFGKPEIIENKHYLIFTLKNGNLTA